jgi:hypothetical protein
MTIVSSEDEKHPALGEQSKDVRDETSVKLIASLRKMVNNPEFSDVVFLCGDGKQVRASKIHLAARSEVLKSLLMNGMAESNAHEIDFPKVSSPVILSVLEFLYTGDFLDYAPENWNLGWEVIIASQFFLLPDLEVIASKYRSKFISSVAGDLPKLGMMLNEALELKSSLKTLTIILENWSANSPQSGPL